MKHEKFTITGMSCSACSARVEKAVNKLDGIDKASVNLLTNSMQASYDENVVSEQDIIQAVVDAGYGASPAEGGSPQSAGAPQKSASDIAKEEMKAMKHRLIGSILFLIPVMYTIPSDPTIIRVIVDEDTVNGGKPHLEYGAVRKRYQNQVNTI